MSKNLLFIIGTRPELIKVFPIIQQLKKIGYNNYKIISTGQHKDLLTTYWKVFDITPDYELDIIKEGQNLTQLTSRAIIAIDDLLTKIEDSFVPDIIISQGDTTTVMASSMVAFYQKIQFAHVEAGLRSFSLEHPFPEEYNRKIASIATQYHFAPTAISKNNLLAENTDPAKIHVVGNTVIDTLHYFIKSDKLAQAEFNNPTLKVKLIHSSTNLVLITCHRRENHNDIDQLIEAIEQLSEENPNTTFIWPVHPNPNVKSKVKNSVLAKINNVIITAPLEYLDLLKVLQNCKVVISDSGGIQEEAPTFRVPVLILRETTERPEAVTLGISKLVGMNKNVIINSFNTFNPVFSEGFINPYGDGNASEKIVQLLLQ